MLTCEGECQQLAIYLQYYCFQEKLSHERVTKGDGVAVGEGGSESCGDGEGSKNKDLVRILRVCGGQLPAKSTRPAVSNLLLWSSHIICYAKRMLDHTAEYCRCVWLLFSVGFTDKCFLIGSQCKFCRTGDIFLRRLTPVKVLSAVFCIQYI